MLSHTYSLPAYLQRLRRSLLPLVTASARDPSFCWMTPWLSSHSRRLSEASSTTVGPLRVANVGWTASDPAPPVAPDTTTTSQAEVPIPLTGCQPGVPGYGVRPSQLGHRTFCSSGLAGELRRAPNSSARRQWLPTQASAPTCWPAPPPAADTRRALLWSARRVRRTNRRGTAGRPPGGPDRPMSLRCAAYDLAAPGTVGQCIRANAVTGIGQGLPPEPGNSPI